MVLTNDLEDLFKKCCRFWTPSHAVLYPIRCLGKFENISRFRIHHRTRVKPSPEQITDLLVEVELLQNKLAEDDYLGVYYLTLFHARLHALLT